MVEMRLTFGWLHLLLFNWSVDFSLWHSFSFLSNSGTVLSSLFISHICFLLSLCNSCDYFLLCSKNFLPLIFAMLLDGMFTMAWFIYGGTLLFGSKGEACVRSLFSRWIYSPLDLIPLFTYPFDPFTVSLSLQREIRWMKEVQWCGKLEWQCGHSVCCGDVVKIAFERLQTVNVFDVIRLSNNSNNKRQ
jgi:hypothetical protein